MTKKMVIAAVAAACSMSLADAEENVNSVVTTLQELKVMQDFRMSDLRNEVEGLGLGPMYCGWFSEQMEDENIPQEIWDRCAPDEDEETNGNEFNPLEYAGLLGDDLCNELMESMW